MGADVICNTFGSFNAETVQQVKDQRDDRQRVIANAICCNDFLESFGAVTPSYSKAVNNTVINVQ